MSKSLRNEVCLGIFESVVRISWTAISILAGQQATGSCHFQKGARLVSFEVAIESRKIYAPALTPSTGLSGHQPSASIKTFLFRNVVSDGSRRSESSCRQTRETADVVRNERALQCVKNQRQQKYSVGLLRASRRLRNPKL
ncbi:MAG: hypothetical protein ACREQX_18360 [Candidatus Binataceae bacterium]